MAAELLLLIFLPLKFYYLVAQIFIILDLDSFRNLPPDLPASRLSLANHSEHCSKVNFPKKHLSVSADLWWKPSGYPQDKISILGSALPGFMPKSWGAGFQSMPIQSPHCPRNTACLFSFAYVGLFPGMPFLKLDLTSPFWSLFSSLAHRRCSANTYWNELRIDSLLPLLSPKVCLGKGWEDKADQLLRGENSILGQGS